MKEIGPSLNRQAMEDLNKNFDEQQDKIDHANRRIGNLITSIPQPREIEDVRLGADGTLYRTAKDRIDAEQQKTNSQLAQTANINYVEFLISTLVSGAPRGVFQTFNDLRVAHPNGTDGVFLVLENNQDESHVYYWDEVDRSWKDAGPYQGTGLEAVLTTDNAPWEVV